MPRRQAAYAREHFLSDAGRERLKIVHLEDLLAHLEASFAGSPLGEYYRRFRRSTCPRLAGRPGRKTSQDPGSARGEACQCRYF